MLMKTYSYVATNGYLSDLARTRAMTESQLRKSTELVGGYDVALAEAKEANPSPNPSALNTQSATPVGTPSEKDEQLGSSNLRHRANAASAVNKEGTVSAQPDTSSYFPSSDVPPLAPHPLCTHPSSNIAVLAESLTQMDLELTSTGKNRVRFPENISYFNFLDFQMVPTVGCLFR